MIVSARRLVGVALAAGLAACREPVPQPLLPLLPPELDFVATAPASMPEGSDRTASMPEGSGDSPAAVPTATASDELVARAETIDPTLQLGAQTLAELLAHPDLRVRRAAATRFARAEVYDPVAIVAIAARLDDEHPVVRQLAAQALARSQHPTAVSALTAAYEEADAADAVVLAPLVARQRGPAAPEALGRRAADPDEAAALAAIEALAGLGSSAAPFLAGAAAGELERACAAQLALARIGAPPAPVEASGEGLLCALAPRAARGEGAALDSLVRALAAPEAGIRDRAAMALSAVDRPEALRALLDAQCADHGVERPGREVLAHALVSAVAIDVPSVIAALGVNGPCAEALARDLVPLLDWLAGHASADHAVALFTLSQARAPGPERDAITAAVHRLESNLNR